MSIVLNDTDKKLEVLLSGAVVANELPFVASYADYVDATPAFTPGANDGVTNGVTPVELVGVPGASTQRLVNNISIYNKDTAAATVTVQYEHGAAHRENIKAVLDVGHSLHFGEDQWQVLNAAGCVLMSMMGSVFSDTEGDPSAINPDDAAADGTSAYAARRDHEHQFTCATPSDTGAANAEGVASTSVRSDHVHKLHNHDHTGDAGDGGQISHDTALTGVSVDDHHAQDHKDRHDPQDGADPLDTAAAAEIVGVQAAAAGTSHSLARADHAHQIQHGIADNHLVTVDHVTPVATDYARFTAAGLEGREPSEVRTDLGLVIGTNVLAEQTIGIADDNLVEVDGPAAGAPASGEYARWTAAGIEGRQKSEILTDLNVADGADVTGSNPPQAHDHSAVGEGGQTLGDTAGPLTLTIENAGCHILDTGGDHDLVITPGSDLSVDRILTLTTGDAARTIVLQGNPTLSDWFDQSVKIAASPTFADVFVPDGGDVGITGNERFEFNAAGYVILQGAALGINGLTPTNIKFGVVGTNAEIVALDQYGIFRYDGDGDAFGLAINYVGYLGGVSRFRDFIVYDGKGTLGFYFDGSAGTLGGGGNQYVGVDNTGKLYKAGAVSDVRLKKNISNISDKLDVLKALDQLNGIYFTMDHEKIKSELDLDFGIEYQQIGLTAQNVEKVLPELVETRDDGYKRLDYQQMVGFLVEVCKTQQAQINRLEAR